MARPRKETDLKGKVMERYEELVAKRNMIDWEIKAIEAYLKATGEIKTQRRGRRKKTESGAESKISPKSKAPTRKAKGAKRESATNVILSLISKSEEGISIDQIMKQTGLGRMTVNGVLNRMKKTGKVKNARRGVYVKG